MTTHRIAQLMSDLDFSKSIAAMINEQFAGKLVEISKPTSAALDLFEKHAQSCGETLTETDKAIFRRFFSKFLIAQHE